MMSLITNYFHDIILTFYYV